jgi:hypothetical protein
MRAALQPVHGRRRSEADVARLLLTCTLGLKRLRRRPRCSLRLTKKLTIGAA